MRPKFETRNYNSKRTLLCSPNMCHLIHGGQRGTLYTLFQFYVLKKYIWCITVYCVQASDALEAIAVNRMSCNISDYCANKMTLKMTITAPVIITNPKVVTE